jgi:predicted metalloprotease with PDZ domain
LTASSHNHRTRAPPHPTLLTTIEKASATAGARPGYLGVEFANGDSTAPVVAGVEPASPAQAAGILPGDIISKIGAVEVPNARALREAIQPLGEGATVPVHLTRSGKDARISYFICPEGGKTMTSISVFCHEFGHMLGLPTSTRARKIPAPRASACGASWPPNSRRAARSTCPHGARKSSAG